MKQKWIWGDMNIENASQNDEPSINNTFIPNGMLGKIIDIYDEIIPYTNEHKTGAIIDFDGVRVKYEKIRNVNVAAWICNFYS